MPRPDARGRVAGCRRVLPEGEPAPADGSLPASALDGVGTRPFGFYVHVPFCAVRCGYCDFNTYTATRARRRASARIPVDVRRGGDRRGPARRGRCSATATSRSRRCSSAAARRPCCRRPTWRGSSPAVGDEFGLADGRRGDDRVQPGQRRRRRPRASCATAGFNRVSFGMQSAVRHVLRGARPHPRPGRACPRSSSGRGEAGFEQVSLDLIYGTPGESLADWAASLEAALACEPDHVSAYALIVEDGTALARRVARGEVPMPDDDDLADKYLARRRGSRARRAGVVRGVQLGARTEAAGAGTTCSTGPAATGGASARARTRTSAACAGGTSSTPRRTPSGSAAGSARRTAREVLDDETRRVERVLLETRLREGLPVDVLDDAGRAGAAGPGRARAGRAAASAQGRVVLTTRGRLLADAVVRDLLT